MARQLDSGTREALVERVRFYRDLGLTEFYRRPVDAARAAALEAAAAIEEAPSAILEKPAALQEEMRPADSLEARFQATIPTPEIPTPAIPALAIPMPAVPMPTIPMEDEPISARKPFPAPPEVAAAVPAANRAAALRMIREEMGDCTRCALHQGRNQLVFGDGDPNARLMFVGEGPGADEDAQGLPFVGRAGQLLNNMIAAMGLKREQVYIANVVKCRPPGNRTPEPDEAHTCSPFLFRQIDVVRPRVLVALGATAATYLLGQRQPLAGLRGRVHPYRGMQLIVTYHPAFLLRDPRQKKEAWADLQIAMKELGLKAPKGAPSS